ncbi:MAG: sigma-70 family RNA polymerase sigma factor [Actinomycetota bacterium]|nr:sigma-70 family RNA polymerase sigma factor [Actinomycetota bacterium]
MSSAVPLPPKDFPDQDRACVDEGCPTGESSDAELTEAIRHGNIDAFGHLWARHVASARRTARTLTSSDTVDDLVSEAFARILKLLRAGRGPTDNFRAYLMATLRTVNIDVARRQGRVVAAGLNEELEPALPPVIDPDGFEGALALRAWASLDDSDRVVLWSRVVDGLSVEETAAAAGLEDKVVAVRTFRARERLREAFLREHIHATTEVACRAQRHRLGAFARGTLADSKRGHLEAHIRTCAGCRLAATEVLAVNRTLKLVIGPIAAAAGGLAALHGVAAASGGHGAGAIGAATSSVPGGSSVLTRHSVPLHRVHHGVQAVRRGVVSHRILTAASGLTTAWVATIAIVVNTSGQAATGGSQLGPPPQQRGASITVTTPTSGAPPDTAASPSRGTPTPLPHLFAPAGVGATSPTATSHPRTFTPSTPGPAQPANQPLSQPAGPTLSQSAPVQAATCSTFATTNGLPVCTP